MRLAKKYKNAYKEEHIDKNKEIIWKQLSVRLYTAGLDVFEMYVHVIIAERVLAWTLGALYPSVWKPTAMYREIPHHYYNNCIH